MNTVIVKKMGMTQWFSPTGDLQAVTVLQADGCLVVDLKTTERDGYSAIKIGASHRKQLNKPGQGSFKALGRGVRPAVLREVRLVTGEEFDVGQKLNVTAFAPGDKVDVTGVSTGKGFAGAIKRHHFGRGPMSHGHDHHRAVGAIGASAHPGRVAPGKRLPGHMGNKQITTQNVEVVKVDAAKNLLYLLGSVPGKKGQFVLIRSAIKQKRVKG